MVGDKMKRCPNKKYVTHSVFFLMIILLYATWYKPIVVKKESAKLNTLSIFLDNLKEQDWYEMNCFDGKLHQSIEKMPLNLESWSQAFERKCQILWSKFQKIYLVDIREGKLEIPEEFQRKLRVWFHNKESLLKGITSQTIIHVRNLYTKEHTVYNPLRAKRPMKIQKKDPKVYVSELASETKKSCDFCNYEQMTAKDTFDRIKGKHSVTAANAFKIDKWHGLMLTKRHNPVEITEEELVDIFNTTLLWFKKVYSIDQSSRFPNVVWDSLPHAGASQVHPHMHSLMDSMHYYGILEEQNAASMGYYEATGNSYWEDIIEIHHALGLAKRFGNAVAITPLTSRKDNELLLLSDEPSLDLFRLLYYVVQTYYEKFKIYCHSSGMAFPVLGERQDGSLPSLIRIATRGDCSSIGSDISSLELYAVYNVNVDLYSVISNVTETVHNLAGKSSLQWKTMIPWV